MIKLGANILSQTVQRNLARSTSDLSRSSERLASGQRINRASDDAAGLAISMSLDKDRILAQTAKRNVSDGISMVSIMSSGLRSQKGILFRMAELAEQSSNGTYSSQQREVLQQEYSSLMDEFDRIGDSTEFNGIKLLRNRDGQTIQMMAGISGADTSLLQVAAVNSHRYAGVLAQRSDWTKDGQVNAADTSRERSYYKHFLPEFYAAYVAAIPNPVDRQRIEDRGFEPTLLTGTRSDGKTVRVSLMLNRTRGSQFPFGSTLTDPPSSREYFVAAVSSDGETVTSENGNLYTEGTTALNVNLTFAISGTTLSFGIDISGLTYQSRDPIGADYSTLPPDAITRQSAIGFTNVLGAHTSRRALDTVMNRIDDLSQIEGQFGAVESRLQVAHSLLSTSGENFAAASSRIKDADFAAESANTVRSQILQQTAASLLGQANQAPQLALRLLQG